LNSNTRRTRFERRVGLEREFLTPVNVIFGQVAPLAGMTRDAILSWRSRAEEARPDLDVTSIAGILLEASARAELLADNSRDVFEPDRRPHPDSLAELRRLLDLALR
jgi:hypothetical protein